jgi:transcription elongation factor Elf1
MSRHRFFDRCDHCARASAEYTPWFHCRECGDNVCDQCSMEGDVETGKALCGRCIAQDVRESMAEQLETPEPVQISNHTEEPR